MNKELSNCHIIHSCLHCGVDMLGSSSPAALSMCDGEAAQAISYIK